MDVPELDNEQYQRMERLEDVRIRLGFRASNIENLIKSGEDIDNMLDGLDTNSDLYEDFHKFSRSLTFINEELRYIAQKKNMGGDPNMILAYRAAENARSFESIQDKLKKLRDLATALKGLK